MSKDFLTPGEVVERFRNSITEKTLANWRWSGIGPDYVKIGTRVLYPQSDLLAFEAMRRKPRK